ncbi:hypothetical protein AB0M95_14950 [Sphaerisporangium sp. NPDC051017]|uniref:hypothetical protein n=1 Tax=Sphaerisporangium sp. NPDC051017 TaxID=3154636 RepID=UPI0034125134
MLGFTTIDTSTRPRCFSRACPFTSLPREQLLGALQERWESALAQRAALGLRSPVPILDGLLEPFRGGRLKVISQWSPKRSEDPTPLAAGQGL